ncbi:MAG: copper(I)-binding protein [Yoonia sp.]|jgi:copper(I)-binding protein
MKIALTLALALIPTFGMAHGYKIGDLTIAHPVARETAATAMTGAGYMTVTNTGETDDVLLEIRADFPRVMMHDTETVDDIATMVQLESLVVRAGETVTFAPGGKHVMFMGLNGDPFEEGETVPATLVFENAGEIAIEFNVEKMTEGHGH